MAGLVIAVYSAGVLHLLLATVQSAIVADMNGWH